MKAVCGLVMSAWICFGNFSVAAPMVIGNPGEAILVDGKPYLRDLVETGEYMSPGLDEEGAGLLDPFQLFRQRSKLAILQDVGFDDHLQDLLLNKLEDADIIEWGLGSVLLDAITLLKWQQTDQDVGAFPEDEEILNFVPPPGSRQTLAIRSGGAVLIMKRLFQQLDDANKVALVIHEALSSLMIVRPDGKNGFFKQSSIPAREATALLFSKTELSCLPREHCLGSAWEAEINVDWDSLNCLMLWENYSVSLPGVLVKGIPWNIEGLVVPSDIDTLSQAWSDATSACDAAEGAKTKMTLSLQRIPYVMTAKMYPFQMEGHTYEQAVLSAVPRPPILEEVLPIALVHDLAACKKAVQKDVSNWYQDRYRSPNNPQVKAQFLQCSPRGSF